MRISQTIDCGADGASISAAPPGQLDSACSDASITARTIQAQTHGIGQRIYKQYVVVETYLMPGAWTTPIANGNAAEHAAEQGLPDQFGLFLDGITFIAAPGLVG